MPWQRLASLGCVAALGSSRIHALCEELSDRQDLELKLVQVVFRHGARTPLTDKYWDGAVWETGKHCGEAYKQVQLSLRGIDGGSVPPAKHDIKQVSTIWPGGCKKGELTVEGQRQSRDLGDWLRQRYVQHLSFLPETYSEGVLSARTTNYARTKATLQGVITGLYQDAPAVTALTATDDDEILIGTSSCSHLSDLIKLQASRLKEEARRDSEVQKLDAEVREAMGLEAGSHIAYTDLYDALTTLKFHGKAWPQKMTEELYLRIELEAFRRMAALVSLRPSDDLGPHILSLSMGQLFQQMTDRMEALARQDSGKEKIVLLSGHDTTIMPIVASLIGDKLDRWPPYVSNLVVELWQAKGKPQGEFYVRLFYNQEEIFLEGAEPGKPLAFSELKEKYWGPHLLSREDYLQRCRVELKQDAPKQAGAVGGDSIQGI